MSRSLAIGLPILLGLAARASAEAPPAAPHPSRDCGAAALYVLLSLEGRPTDLAEVTRALPPLKSGGYSMREIRDAARPLGLRLAGVSIAREGRSIDRPAIAHLDVGKGGHFVVIRPVGHTGNLVQVIDSTQSPIVIDRSELISSKQWTGFVLVPPRANWLALSATGLASVLILSGAAMHLGRRRMRPASLAKAHP